MAYEREQRTSHTLEIRRKERQMSSAAVDRDREATDRVRTRKERVVTKETKVAFQTTEFMVYLLSVAGVLIASAIDDTIDARLAWILVAAVGVGYMLSRGLAKSGSVHRPDADRL
jgi:hypothetical protein